MDIMRGKLEVPLQCAGIRIKSDDAIRVKVVALAGLPEECGSWITRSPVEQIELGVIGTSNPRRATARLPRIAIPRLVRRIIRPGNRVEAPEPLATSGLVSLYESAIAEISPSDAYDDLVFQG